MNIETIRDQNTLQQAIRDGLRPKYLADRDREPWLVDSTRRWHFDSLRDLAEPLPVPAADHSIDHDHDFSLDR